MLNPSTMRLVVTAGCPDGTVRPDLDLTAARIDRDASRPAQRHLTRGTFDVLSASGWSRPVAVRETRCLRWQSGSGMTRLGLVVVLSPFLPGPPGSGK